MRRVFLPLQFGNQGIRLRDKCLQHFPETLNHSLHGLGVEQVGTVFEIDGQSFIIVDYIPCQVEFTAAVTAVNRLKHETFAGLGLVETSGGNHIDHYVEQGVTADVPFDIEVFHHHVEGKRLVFKGPQGHVTNTFQEF